MNTDALDEVLRAAVRVRVTEGDAVLAEVDDPGALEDLRRALAVRGTAGGSCMCRGDLGLEFHDRAGERVAVVSFHRPSAVRWAGWDEDAALGDGSLLPRWLAVHGVEETPPDSDRQRWIAAAPEAVRDLLDLAAAAAAGNGVFPQGVVRLVRARLREAVPDPAERARALRIWYAAGTVFRALPEQLITKDSQGSPS
ncbi:hypothetical protein AB0J80_37780 [Actinoplanes sp. NPDC049548]|uniref:hypothetical protein n=1 Tax=Actinoplanes sp. NPDC049548 TaxID=3155152 RepID=UPI003434C80D